MREFALRASSENCHTNYHYSEEVGKKMIASKDSSVIIYILCISLTKLKP